MTVVLLADAALAVMFIAGSPRPPALHRAAGAGDTAWIERQLASGTPVDITDQSGESPLEKTRATALMWAAAKAQEEAALLLIAAGADVSALDASGVPVLVHAAAGGSTAIIEALLVAGCDWSAFVRDRRTVAGLLAVEVAAAAGHADAVEVLLNTGPFSGAGEARPDQPLQALSYAARSPNAEVMSRVLDHFDRTGVDRASMLLAAVQWGIMNDAAARGRTETVRVLVRAGVSPDPEKGQRPIWAAISGGWKETMLELIAAGASIECEQGHLISEAIQSGRPELVAPLIDAGAKIDCGDHGVGPLLTAVYYNDLASAELLVQSGAAVEWSLDDGRVMTLLNALHSVPTTDSMLEFAIRHSSDIDVREDDMTLLMQSAAKGDHAAAHLLLKHGADPLAVDPRGRSARSIVQGHLDDLRKSSQQTPEAIAELQKLLDAMDRSIRARSK